MGTFRSLCLVCAVVGVDAGLQRADAVDQSSDAQQLQRFEYLQIRMAVPVRITVYAPDEPTANLASQAAYARIKQLDRTLSHYDPDSELSQLCQNAVPGVPVKVSSELFSVLSEAAEVSQKTGGAFDVTVGPFMDLWRKARRTKQLPDADTLAAARDRVGFQKVKLDPATQSVAFEQSGMRLDLGGIAKGYAADEALRVLNEHGVTRALIAVAGDIVAGEPPPDASGWSVAIGSLESPDDTAERVVKLANAAISTSGDASQYIEIDGVRYSHILDPRTGLGVIGRSSVTVLARDGMTADVWASAVSVLGPEQGLKSLEQVPEAQALIVYLDESGLKRRDSAGFPREGQLFDAAR